MYLNLDLLYVLDAFTFPLFYYSNGRSQEIYCPLTLKSIFKMNVNYIEYCDYMTSSCTINNSTFTMINNDLYKFTEEYYLYKGTIWLEKCKPFKIKEKEYIFLKSNKRIN